MVNSQLGPTTWLQAADRLTRIASYLVIPPTEIERSLKILAQSSAPGGNVCGNVPTTMDWRREGREAIMLSCPRRQQFIAPRPCVRKNARRREIPCWGRSPLPL